MQTKISTIALGVVMVSGIAFAQAPQAGDGNIVRYERHGGTSIGRPPVPYIHVPFSYRVVAGDPRVLNWRLGLAADVFPGLSFTEAAVQTDAQALAYIEGVSTQKVSPEITRNLDYNLSADDLKAVTAELRRLQLKMVTYRVEAIPADESSRRKLFTFAKALGAETIVTNSDPSSLAELDKLADEYGVNVAIVSRGNPKTLMTALEGRGKRMGVAVDLGTWMKAGVKPLDGLATVKTRLIAMNLRDHSTPGQGVAEMDRLFHEMYRLDLKPLFFTVNSVGAADVKADLSASLNDFETAIQPIIGLKVGEIGRALPTQGPEKLPAEAKTKLEAAAPHQAIAKPKKPRKLLVTDLVVADGAHATIPYANYAIAQMAKNTDAFQVVFSNDMDNLKYPKIKQFDAVVFNNCIGQVLVEKEVQEGLLRFVREGGGVAGLHGATWMIRNFPEFGVMMGTGEGPHRVEKGTLKLDDPTNPMNAGFGGKEFEVTDELYLFNADGPYSRNKVHLLFSIDTDKMDLSAGPYIRPDNDYGLSWIKTYGKGRVFNFALGHTPEIYETPALAEHVFGGLQFVLGDLDLDTTPTGKLAAKK